MLVAVFKVVDKDRWKNGARGSAWESEKSEFRSVQSGSAHLVRFLAGGRRERRDVMGGPGKTKYRL